jgi:hypothetical protein
MVHRGRCPAPRKTICASARKSSAAAIVKA